MDGEEISVGCKENSVRLVESLYTFTVSVVELNGEITDYLTRDAQ